MRRSPGRNKRKENKASNHRDFFIILASLGLGLAPKRPVRAVTAFFPTNPVNAPFAGHPPALPPWSTLPPHRVPTTGLSAAPICSASEPCLDNRTKKVRFTWSSDFRPGFTRPRQRMNLSAIGARARTRSTGGWLATIFSPWKPDGPSACLPTSPWDTRFSKSEPTFPMAQSPVSYFCIEDGCIYLLDSFIKKTRETSQTNLELAKARRSVLLLSKLQIQRQQRNRAVPAGRPAQDKMAVTKPASR